MLLILVLIIIMYVTFDFNYFVQTFFVGFSSVFQRKCSLDEVTTIYGIGTFLDCDVSFRQIRSARLVREIDFARYYFYYRTGIYYERKLKMKFLQGCTFTMNEEPVPLFTIYKINTKLAYWDEKSLFFEHEIVTLNDGRVRCFLISRQHAIGEHDDSTETLLIGLPGSKRRPQCPHHIKLWLESMQISSQKLRRK